MALDLVVVVVVVVVVVLSCFSVRKGVTGQ
jgi:hypothetical protein